MPRFSVPAPTFDWVANHEKTRWFLVMKLSRPAQNELNALLRISNQIAQSFGQLPLYAEPQPIMGSPISKRSKPPSPSTQNPASEDMSSNFHISIAWTLHPPSQSMLEQIQHLNHDFPALQIPIQTIKAKIGNTVSSIPLASKTDSSNKILE